MCKVKRGRTVLYGCVSFLLTVAWGIVPTNVIAQPLNDAFSNSRKIFGDTGSVTGSNEGATKEPGETDHAGNAAGTSVWIKWTPLADGVVTFDTIGSDFDTLLEVYDGAGVTNLNQLGGPLDSNDDLDTAVFGTQDSAGASGIQFQVAAGNDYYIVIDGFNANVGGYTLNWKRGGTRSAGEFEFTSRSYFVTENEGRSGDDPAFNRDALGALITVTRKNGSSGKVRVDYTTQDDQLGIFDPAVEGLNYILSSGTLIFEDHQMSASFIVPILNDQGSLDKEIFRTVFSVALAGANLDPAESPDLAPPILSPSRAVASVVISDENPTYPNAGTVQFSQASYRRLEDVGVATIQVSRSGGDLNQALTVTYSVNYSPAGAKLGNGFQLSAGSDYATPSTEANADFTAPPAVLNTLTIPAGEATANILIPITNDFLVEFNEDILIRLDTPGSPAISPGYVPPVFDPNDPARVTTQASGYRLGAQRNAVLTILFDEYPAGAVDANHNPDYANTTIPPFNPIAGANRSVYTVAVQTDQKTVLGGSFTTYNGVARNRIARMNNDGSLDTTFNPGTGANDFVSSLKVASDGRIIIGGGFTSFNGVSRNSIARLNSNGALDNSFAPGLGANGTVWALAIQADGKILIGGEFSTVNGIPRNDVARLSSDGSLDLTFDAGTGPDDSVFSIVQDADSTILIGGEFTTVNLIPRSSIARLASNGALSTSATFGGGADGIVYSLTLQPDRKILMGGAFAKFDGRSRSSIARLNNNGTLDTTFDPGTGANDTVYAVAYQPDGKIMVGGVFTSINGTRRMGVGRLLSTGLVDTSFLDTAYNQFAGLVNSFDNLAVEPRNFVFALGLESSGDLIIGGGFTKVGGGRGSRSVRPDQTFLDDRTRATYRNRSNVAKLIGGSTPGPGNIGFAYDTYSADEGASPFYITLARTNGNLGAV
ncbi:MAG: Calx-beta domain-containing protein, partial [Verrucomicrobiota bacterium]